MLADAIRWYDSRPARETTTRRHRYGRARTLAAAERWAEARASFAELIEADPDNIDYLGYLGVIAANDGEIDEALRIRERLAAMDPKYRQRGSHLYWRACVSAQLGEHDDAVRDLREAYADGLAYSAAHHKDPFLVPLRGRPGFAELMRPL